MKSLGFRDISPSIPKHTQTRKYEILHSRWAALDDMGTVEKLSTSIFWILESDGSDANADEIRAKHCRDMRKRCWKHGGNDKN